MVQAHEEQVRQLERGLSHQSDRLNSLEMEACELRRQLSSLRVTLAEEEASHNQARMVSHLTPYSASSTVTATAQQAQQVCQLLLSTSKCLQSQASH